MTAPSSQSLVDPLGIAGQIVAEKYRIERAVGQGGFAVVYRAEHVIWKQPVAIKFFSELSSVPVDQRDAMQSAFIEEGRLLTQLSSQTAAIVQARDVGTYTTPDGRWMPYMVLEWLEGRSLEELIVAESRAGRPHFTLGEVLRLLGPVAAALDVAHGRGIAHRDVKPPNIFVLGDDPRQGSVAVKILDFGVAKLITDNTQMKAAMAKTGASITSFTPQYGAPEQFSRTYGATGPWTDVFALALVVVEMLSGRPALDGDDVVQLAFSAGNPERRPTPRLLGVDLGEAVERVLAKALRVQPAERHARAGEFWAAFEVAAGTGSSRATAAEALNATMAMPESLRAAITPVRPAGTEAMRDPVTVAAATLTPRAAQTKSRGAWFAALGVLTAALAAGAFFALRAAGDSRGAAPTSSAPTPPPSAAVAASGDAPAAARKCPGDMFEIPAGQFYMGTDAAQAPDNQKPAHNVQLDGFCMDATEVTVAAYLKCSGVGACRRLAPEVSYVGMKPSEEKAFKPLCNVDVADRSDHPMNCVSWRDAETYCRKSDKRLPTEAEWEYATRGPDGRVYPWGDEKPTVQHLNACDAECLKWSKRADVGVLVLFESASDGYAATSPVGKFPGGSSRFGPKDVVGNVWEWVQDFEGKYTADESKNPSGPSSGERRVLRGGAWNGAREEWLHPSFRFAAEPERRHPAIGFRCARGI